MPNKIENLRHNFTLTYEENIFLLDLWGNVTQTLSLFSLASTSYLWLHTITTIIINLLQSAHGCSL